MARPPSTPSKTEKTDEFYRRNKVFTLEEFVAAQAQLGRKRWTVHALLQTHLAASKIVQLRRGLFAVGDGLTAEGPDPFVVASKLTPDCVLAYAGALTFHGLLSLQHTIHFLTAHRQKYFAFDEVIYTAVSCTDPRAEEHVQCITREGTPVFTTTPERTLVDLLDRIEFLFDPADLWAAFKKARKTLDLDAVMKRARTLDRATTYARLGLFLENLRGVDHELLRKLEWRAPKTAAYFNRPQHDSEKGMGIRYVLHPRWRLVMDEDFLLHLEGKNPGYRRALTFLEA